MPLPLGYTSECEMIDIWFDCELSITNINNSLLDHIHQGLGVLIIENIDIQSPKIQNIVRSVDYQCVFNNKYQPEDIKFKFDTLTNSDNILWNRRGKSFNLKQHIINIAMSTVPENIVLNMVLKALPGQTGRPDEILSYLGVDPSTTHIHRNKLTIDNSF